VASGQGTEVRFSRQVKELAVPANEQSSLLSLVSAGDSEMLKTYLATLVYPRANMCRVPDSYPRPTALVRSISTFDVPVYLDTTIDSGRFAISILPTLGGTNTLQAYKQALVDGSSPWPRDFSDQNNFTSVLGGRDLRVDQFFGPLTQGSPGLLHIAANIASTANPFSGGAHDLPVSYGLGYAIASGGLLKLPPGAYIGTAVATNAASPITITLTASTPGNLSILNAGGPVNTGYVVFVWVVTSPSDTLEFIQAGAFATTTDFSLTVTNTQTSFGGASTNFGAVSQIRPVAMSCLATYVNTTLLDGGNIAGAYVPGGTLASNYFTSANNVTAQGSYANWENLSLSTSSYNGPIRDGCYVWWCPEDIVDYELTEPANSSAHDFPSIMIAGKFSPGGDFTTPQSATPIRLEIVTVYEFSTNSQLWEKSACVGSQAIIDAANRLLASQQHAMQNKVHLQWLKDLANGIGKIVKPVASFLYNNRNKLLPMAGEMASMFI